MNTAASRRIEGPAWIQVAVPRRLWQTFTYHLPGGMVAWPSSRVLVPFGRRKITAYVIREEQTPPSYGVKSVVRVLDEDAPLFPAPLMKTLMWAASYYHYPPGEVFRTAHPPLGSVGEEVRYALGDMGRHILKTWPLVPPDAPRVDAATGRLMEFFRERTDKAYKRNYLKSKGFSESLLDRAVVSGILRPVVEMEKDGSTGTEDAVMEARLPDDPDTLAWLERGSARNALLRELVEVPKPVSVSAIRQVRKDATRILKDLASRGLVTLGSVPRQSHWRPWEGHTEDIRHVLTADQEASLVAITSALGSYRAFLLQGITGSGKTEVYLRVIEEVLGQGRGAIVLVPEISITPQLASRFELRFPGLVSVLHSGLSDAQRAAHWRSIASGRTRIVVGARSALFAPMNGVGIIVVDEEHDSSFKQEDGFRYSARDLAFIRARNEGAVLVLGSATPSMETRYGAETGSITRLVLSTRPTGRPLPDVTVVDMRSASKEGPFSSVLLGALGETLDSGSQAILFVNRRGYFGRFRCARCGEVVTCPNCSVAMVQHKSQGALVCHYCGHRIPPPEVCPSCGGPFARFIEGTERVTEALRRLFPGASIERLDSDTTRYGTLERKLARFRRGEVDILVGTQIVTKGHDFPGVTLVGVLDADQPLYMQDFRAAERAFQLLVQVAGRAGRGDRPGRVVVQTHSPSHHAISAAVRHDTEAFFVQELAYRRELAYPPLGLLALVRVVSRDEDRATAHAMELAESVSEDGVQVLGPVQAPVYMVRGRYRWQILLKSRRLRPLHSAIKGVLFRRHPSSVDVTVDVDPLTF